MDSQGTQPKKPHESLRTIKRIEIRNFRGIRQLQLHLDGGRHEQAPWLMLLGENGTGKTSVLQAVALALAGEEYCQMLPIGPSDVLRYGCSSGHVRIFWTDTFDPVELVFQRGSAEFEGRREQRDLILAYGATRLLPQVESAPVVGLKHAYARLDNLFNPFIPLEDCTEWLLSLSAQSFDYIACALKDLLFLEEDSVLVRRDGRIYLDTPGAHVALEQLSYGSLSILALASDIMAVIQTRWEDMELAEGIVLLDEIDVHLHPRWQMRIVESLRRVFPRVQFLATTHSPLCLRGLYDGEIFVMVRATENEIVAISDLPPVAGLRADQLLTSEFFGLHSTVDPNINGLFNEYYGLKASRERSAIEEMRLEELKAQLDGLQLMGQTRRERLMLEAIDDFLAEEREQGTTVLQPKERVRRRLRKILSELGAEEGR